MAGFKTLKQFIFLTLKKVLWKDKLSFFLIFCGLAVNLACWLVLWTQIKPDETGVILHYNIFFGIDAISFDLENFYFQVFLAPAGGLFIWFVNFILGFVLFFQVILERERENPLYLVEKKKKAKKRQQYLDYLDAKSLSGYLLWAGSLSVQLALAVYVTAIVLVNK